MPRNKTNRRGSRRSRPYPARKNRAQPNLVQQMVAASATSTSYRLPRVLDVKEMYVKRDHSITVSSMYIAASQITFSTITPNGYAFPFILTNMPDYADYVLAFDQYKVLQLSYYFEPRGTFTAGTLLTAIDYDDDNVPTTATELMEYETCQINTYGTSFARVVNPRVASLVYSSIVPSYASTRGWIDCASDTVRHYGLKCVTELGSNNGAAWDVRIRVVVSFRNKR